MSRVQSRDVQNCSKHFNPDAQSNLLQSRKSFREHLQHWDQLRPPLRGHVVFGFDALRKDHEGSADAMQICYQIHFLACSWHCLFPLKTSQDIYGLLIFFWRVLSVTGGQQPFLHSKSEFGCWELFHISQLPRVGHGRIT